MSSSEFISVQYDQSLVNSSSQDVKDGAWYKPLVLPGRVLSIVCAIEKKHGIEDAIAMRDMDIG